MGPARRKRNTPVLDVVVILSVFAADVAYHKTPYLSNWKM
jgi:hypothetical protein